MHMIERLREAIDNRQPKLTFCAQQAIRDAERENKRAKAASAKLAEALRSAGVMIEK